MFFHFYKKHLKTWIKTVNCSKCSILSSKKHRQYESNKVKNTATKHSLCPGNGVCQKPHNFVRLCFNNNENTTLKSTKKHKK